MVVELIPRFDGKEAYWWLIQAEQYFGSRRMSEDMKLRWVVAFALREDALDWWNSWKESNPNTCWWDFSKAILKKFQLEVWDCLLDSENEGQENRGNTEIQEEEPEIELERLTIQGSLDVQQGTNQGKNVLIEIEEDKEKNHSENEWSIAEPMEGGLKVVREISEIEWKMTVIDEDVKENKIENVGKMEEELHHVQHSVRPIVIVLPSTFTIINIEFDRWNTDDRCEGNDRGLLVERRPTAAILCFWAKNTTQNRVYDPGICFHAPHLDLSLYFKLWDPGGQLCYPSP